MNSVRLNNFKLKCLLSTLVFFLCMNTTYAQPNLPQRSMTVQATQALNFGTFALSGGGDGIVTVGFNGSRTAVSNVYLADVSPLAQQAIFEIKLCQGRNVTITYLPTAIITGSNGGTMTLDIGPTEKGGIGSTFEVDNDCNFITILQVGGTLHIPATSPPGNYSGTFEITFNQE